MGEALDLLVYDRTCRGRPLLPGLSHAWGAGARLYRARGLIDLARGVDSWEEALDWLASVEPERPVAQIQFWGHGKWGLCLVGEQELSARSLERGIRTIAYWRRSARGLRRTRCGGFAPARPSGHCAVRPSPARGARSSVAAVRGTPT